MNASTIGFCFSFNDFEKFIEILIGLLILKSKGFDGIFLRPQYLGKYSLFGLSE